jgi:hypothetical protein
MTTLGWSARSCVDDEQIRVGTCIDTVDAKVEFDAAERKGGCGFVREDSIGRRRRSVPALEQAT